MTEDTPAKPDTFYAKTKLVAERIVLDAKTKLAAERIVIDAKRTDGQPLGTVLRFGAIYGSIIKGNYPSRVSGRTVAEAIYSHW